MELAPPRLMNVPRRMETDSDRDSPFLGCVRRAAKPVRAGSSEPFGRPLIRTKVIWFDPGQRNGPRRRAVTRANLRSKLPRVHGVRFQGRRYLHRLQLHIDASMSGNGIRRAAHCLINPYFARVDNAPRRPTGGSFIDSEPREVCFW